MKKTLWASAAAVFLLSGSLLADPGGWGMGFDLLFAPLSGDDDNYVKSGAGVDLYGTYQWADHLTQTFGFNALGYAGRQHFDSTGRGIEPDRVSVRALYTGVKLHTRIREGFGWYLRFDVGISTLSDVDQEVSVGSTVLGTERAFEGGRGGYFGAGAGLTWRFSEQVGMTLGWQLRDYGNLDGNSGQSGRLVATDDVSILTGSYNLGLTYRF